jgi:hypothetical protein
MPSNFWKRFFLDRTNPGATMPTDNVNELIAKYRHIYGESWMTECLSALHAANAALAARVEALEAAVGRLDNEAMVYRPLGPNKETLESYGCTEAEAQREADLIIAAVDAAKDESKPSQEKPQVPFTGLRYRNVSDDVERRLGNIRGLGTFMANATIGDWLEGVGDANCHATVQTWQTIGKFLLGLEPPQEVREQAEPTELDPKHPAETCSKYDTSKWVSGDANRPRCTRCNGNGRIEMLEHCPACKGSGFEPAPLSDAAAAAIGRAWGKENGKEPYGNIRWAWSYPATDRDEPSTHEIQWDVWCKLRDHSDRTSGWAFYDTEQLAWIALGRAVHKLGLATEPKPQDDADKRTWLIERKWEYVMPEEDGCETWAFPWELRKNWPEWAKRQHGTQHHWDLKEAVELQSKLEAATKPSCELVALCERWEAEKSQGTSEDFARAVAMRTCALELRAAIRALANQ